MLNFSIKTLTKVLFVAWMLVPAITLFALLTGLVKADSLSLVTGQSLVVDTAQTPGDTYFMSWYQGQAITFYDGWFGFDLKPVDTSEITLNVDSTTPSGVYHFLQFTVPRFADPHDFNAWQDVKSFNVNVQHCSGFSPPLPGCESYQPHAPW